MPGTRPGMTRRRYKSIRGATAPAMIRITPSISIGEGELEEHFIRASGPGGQNVNKLASAVQLRFDVRRSPSLPEPVPARLERPAAPPPPPPALPAVHPHPHPPPHPNPP